MMSKRTSLQGLALVVAAAGLAAAGCSSSGSSSATSAASSAASKASSAASSAISSAASAAASAAGGSVSAADCKVLKPVASNALSVLTPLQSESGSKANAAIASYVTSLKAIEAKLTSAGGKQLMNGYIAALEKLPTESTAAASTAMAEQMGKLTLACP
jgi:hypothetical protein